MSGGAVGGGKKSAPNIDLVPILDAMTSVIFFLILSCAFIEYTKLTLPPSKTALVNATDAKNPLAPRLFGLVKGPEKIEVVLLWQGDKPGITHKEVNRSEPQKRSVELEIATKELISEFAKQYPEEKSLQLGISKSGSYQELISLMDGVRNSIQDIVLISHTEEALISSKL
jgi:biopolymer transport protein ExbD